MTDSWCFHDTYAVLNETHVPYEAITGIRKRGEKVTVEYGSRSLQISVETAKMLVMHFASYKGVNPDLLGSREMDEIIFYEPSPAELRLVLAESSPHPARCLAYHMMTACFGVDEELFILDP
jgi:hypothetical protein